MTMTTDISTIPNYGGYILKYPRGCSSDTFIKEEVQRT